MAKMLYNWKVRKRVTTIRAFAGGVVEEYRPQGLHALIIVETMKRCVPKYKDIELSGPGEQPADAPDRSQHEWAPFTERTGFTNEASELAVLCQK